jgi:hypothetical protein
VIFVLLNLVPRNRKMNEQDKKAFEEWGSDQDGDRPMLEGAAYETWQAACEYKQKEIDAWEKGFQSLTYSIEQLQEQNKKLRECVEFCVDRYFDVPIEYRMKKGLTESEQSKRARQCLEEIEKYKLK